MCIQNIEIKDFSNLLLILGCRDTKIGNTYRGQHVFTVSGRLCQRWDKQLPHRHIHTDPASFPDASLFDASNYCRNPDDDPEGPWCYTTDSDLERETCNIPMCSGRPLQITIIK